MSKRAKRELIAFPTKSKGTPVSRLIGKLQTRVSRSTLSNLWKLHFALEDLEVRALIYNRTRHQLITVTRRDAKPYPRQIKTPRGYSKASFVKGAESDRLSEEMENLCSMLLEGVFIVTERLKKSTIQLEKEIGSVVANQNGRAKRQDRGSAPWIIQNTSFQNYSSKSRSASKLLAELVSFRGERTHVQDFMLFVERSEGQENETLRYSLWSPFLEGAHGNSLKESKLARSIQSLRLLVNWWCDRIDQKNSKLR